MFVRFLRKIEDKKQNTKDKVEQKQQQQKTGNIKGNEQTLGTEIRTLSKAVSHNRQTLTGKAFEHTKTCDLNPKKKPLIDALNKNHLLPSKWRA